MESYSAVRFLQAGSQEYTLYNINYTFMYLYYIILRLYPEKVLKRFKVFKIYASNLTRAET